MMKIVIRIIILWFFVHVTISIIDGIYYNGSASDVAVILGNKVNEDGTLSERLKARLDCGLMLYKDKRIKKIIVSGGLGSEGYNEAEKMQDYLVKNGVIESDIYVDNKGFDTEATVLNSIEIMDSLNYKNVTVVSQYFHLTRTKMLFRKHGFNNVNSASPKYFEIRDIYSIFREFFAFYAEL